MPSPTPVGTPSPRVDHLPRSPTPPRPSPAAAAKDAAETLCGAAEALKARIAQWAEDQPSTALDAAKVAVQEAVAVAAKALLATQAASEPAAPPALQTGVPAPANQQQVRPAAPVLAQVQAQPLMAPPPGAAIQYAARAGRTARELWEVCTPAVAARSLVGQARGLPARGPAPAIAPATTNAKGCWISTSRGQQHGGHCQMAPLFPRARTRAANGLGPQTTKRMPQLLHRLSIRAWGTWNQLRHLLEDGWEASHLCHEPGCFRPDHLVVEPHLANMHRRRCAAGQVCPCVPACLV